MRADRLGQHVIAVRACLLVSGSPVGKDWESRCDEPPIRIPAPLSADSQPDTTVPVKDLNTVLAPHTVLEPGGLFRTLDAGSRGVPRATRSIQDSWR